MTNRKTPGKKRISQKVTISLPPELVEFADQLAGQAGTSRSQAVAEALRIAKRAERDRLMAEGFRLLADESVEMAEEAMGIVNEVWPRD